jgi:hypothetical protein
MFPISVAVATLGSSLYLVGALTLGPVTEGANFDLEYEAGRNGVSAPAGLWPNVGWFAGFIIATSSLGFMLGALCFFIVFLRLKAQIDWKRVAILSAGALAILLILTNVLVVELPEGLISSYMGLSWTPG